MSRENFKAQQLRQALRQMAGSLGIQVGDRTCEAIAGKGDGYVYQMTVNEAQTEASVRIYGTICEYAWEDYGEMSAVLLSDKLQELPASVERINVHLNSYGGSVKEGIAIYNMLRAHGAKVVTHCDAMACSIASVIFMAGDERVMSHASELMIHNAWAWTVGNSKEMRKAADDLDRHTDMSVKAYMSRVCIDEPKLRELMDAESWISPEEALEMGFATRIEDWCGDDEEDEADAMALATPAPQQAATQSETEPEREPEPEEGPEDEPEEGEAPEQAEQKRGIDWPGIIQALKAAE